MTPEARKLRHEADQALDNHNLAKARLEAFVRNCPHDFPDPVYDPIISGGYEIPGDPPGTMGVDWRGPVYVPKKQEDQWTRTCRLCGKVEHTKDVTIQETKKPKF